MDPALVDALRPCYPFQAEATTDVDPTALAGVVADRVAVRLRPDNRAIAEALARMGATLERVVGALDAREQGMATREAAGVAAINGMRGEINAVRTEIAALTVSLAAPAASPESARVEAAREDLTIETLSSVTVLLRRARSAPGALAAWARSGADGAMRHPVQFALRTAGIAAILRILAGHIPWLLPVVEALDAVARLAGINIPLAPPSSLP